MRPVAKIQRALAGLVPTVPTASDLPPDELVKHTLEWLGLTQAQIAALLAVSPQAVSKGFRDEGLDYLAREQRVNPLYQTLVQIGGERYANSAARLNEVAQALGWGSLEAPSDNLVVPRDLYAHAEELWFMADNPAALVDWDALRGHLISAERRELQKLVVFFTRTLEGAERWAEVLERELARTALLDGRLDMSRASTAASYIYIITTNAMPFSQDHVLVNPGSRCMGLTSAARALGVYTFAGASYARLQATNVDFVRVSQAAGLGMSNLKVNFFPKGKMLRSDELDFPHVFMDGVIAARGATPTEDQSPGGDQLAGGFLRSTVRKSDNTILFNRQAKFTPLYLLTYKRKPGEGLNKNPNKAIRAFQEEFDRTRESAPEEARPQSFW